MLVADVLNGSTHNGGFQERIICYILYIDNDYIVHVYFFPEIKVFLFLSLFLISQMGLDVGIHSHMYYWANEFR